MTSYSFSRETRQNFYFTETRHFLAFFVSSFVFFFFRKSFLLTANTPFRSLSSMEKEKESYWKDLPSLKEIQAAIPKNLFERSLRHSLLYLFVDILQVSSLIYLGTHIPLVPYFFVRVILWPIYWFILGTVATGLWVLAHECGHQGFSPYRSGEPLCRIYFTLYPPCSLSLMEN